MAENKGLNEVTISKLKNQVEMLRKQIIHVSNDLEYEHLLHQIRDLNRIIQRNSGSK